MSRIQRAAARCSCPLRYNADAVQADRGEQVSKGGGVAPRWSPDGRELFYLAPDASLMAVDVRRTADLSR